MAENRTYGDEKQKLDDTIHEIRNQIGRIGPRYTGKDYTEQLLDGIRQDRKARLVTALREPSFGRLDFRELGTEGARPLYIGKIGVGEDEGHDLLVVDWRAPVSSLFYSFTGGDAPVTYESPDGDVSGTVHLKRNLLVRDGELQRLVDSYVEGDEEGTVTDEFLLHKLGESKDNKLKDIVSTIQQEQDAIIRTEKNKAVFIQGVAGSGKTTVALHRLAYLLYRYQDRVRAERMMILAPSKMFLNYISGVLPELGVGDILQTTFEDWAMEQIGETIVMQDPAEALHYWFERSASKEERDGSQAKLKGGLDFLRQVDESLDKLEAAFLPDEPFSPDERRILPSERIADWFKEEPADEPLMKRRERLLNRIKRWMEIELGKERWSDKEIKAKANARFKSYASKVPSWTAAQFYAASFPNVQSSEPAGSSLAEQTKKPKAQGKTQGAGKGGKSPKRVFEREDLAPIVHIHTRFFGTSTPAYDHVVIDEAQDYSPFQLAVLRKRQRVSSMTVLGDLQQGIHDYSGIARWEELEQVFPSAETAYYELDRSYRSTMEIIEFANRILAGMGSSVKPARPVFRSGDPVETIRADGSAVDDVVAATLQEWKQRADIKTIAVLGRTSASCEAIHKGLQARGIPATLLQAKNQHYDGGLTVVPVYLSKGLEFDAVLLPDADSSSYLPEDAKLLYVGCTRALHLLKLIYQETLTTLIHNDELSQS